METGENPVRARRRNVRKMPLLTAAADSEKPIEFFREGLPGALYKAEILKILINLRKTAARACRAKSIS